MNILKNSEEANLGMIIVDSVTAVHEDEQFEEDCKDNSLGQHARFWSRFSPVLVDHAHRANVPILLINQTRTKINTGRAAWGQSIEDKEDPTGGKALRFWKSLSLYLQSSGKEKDETAKVDVLTGQKVSTYTGNKIFGKTFKSKLNTPHMQGYGFIQYGKGFDNLEGAIDMFIFNDLVHQSGKWYTFVNLEGQEIKVESWDNLYIALKKDPALCNTWAEQKLGLMGEYF